MICISVFLIFLLFALGLILIVRGGDRFVDAAVWMAAASGIPPFVIGATVVSFATTLPEMIVSVTAALSGQVDMATGNAIGSVTANTALILPLSVIFLPGAIDRTRYLPKSLILITSVLLLWMTGVSGMLTPFGCGGLFLLFLIFVAENLHRSKEEGESLSAQRPSVDRAAVTKNIIFFILGAAEIILGSRLLVTNGALIARDVFHIDERIISLTMVAVGTSLPELVTAVSAVIKRRGSLTAGNILGANIIDTLLILPACALVSGGTLPISRATVCMDIPFCLLVIVLMLVPALLKGKFFRIQGIGVMLLYLIYTVRLFTF